MPRPKQPRVCIECGATEDVNKRSKLCFTCAMKRQHASVVQLHGKKGPIYEKWKARIIESLEEADKTG